MCKGFINVDVHATASFTQIRPTDARSSTHQETVYVLPMTSHGTMITDGKTLASLISVTFHPSHIRQAGRFFLRVAGSAYIGYLHRSFVVMRIIFYEIIRRM